MCPFVAVGPSAHGDIQLSHGAYAKDGGRFAQQGGWIVANALTRFIKDQLCLLRAVEFC